jgi:hypothetical protein
VTDTPGLTLLLQAAPAEGLPPQLSGPTGEVTRPPTGVGLINSVAACSIDDPTSTPSSAAHFAELVRRKTRSESRDALVPISASVRSSMTVDGCRAPTITPYANRSVNRAYRYGRKIRAKADVDQKVCG